MINTDGKMDNPDIDTNIVNANWKLDNAGIGIT